MSVLGNGNFISFSNLMDRLYCTVECLLGYHYNNLYIYICLYKERKERLLVTNFICKTITSLIVVKLYTIFLKKSFDQFTVNY